MKRYEKVVLEAKDGINFEISEETSGELIIRAMSVTSNNVILEKVPSVSARELIVIAMAPTSNYAILEKLPSVSVGEYAKLLSVYIDKDGNKAIVPPGWTVSGVESENTIWDHNKGLVIYRIPDKKVCDICWTNQNDVEFLKSTYDQMVWVPVKLLEANGTLDGVSFTEKFGRRNYRDDEFSDRKFNEPLNGELLEQIESVKKYGGFYISRYNISKSSEGEPQSVKRNMPWTDINFNNAKKLASTMECNEAVKSHLVFGAEYDSVLEWFIKTEVKTIYDIVSSSTKWGNYWNTENSPQEVVETGSREDWCANNIYDFAGNVSEYTQERRGKSYGVIRGGDFYYIGASCPAGYRCNPNDKLVKTSFRVAFYIK